MIPRRRLLHAAAASGLLLVPLSACADEPGGGLAASEEVLERATTTEATTTTSPPTTEATTTTTTTEPPPTVEVGPLASGSHGPRTEALQANLARLGFDPGEPDGRFGAKTTMAVWAFQALNGLPKDGVVTEEVEARIAEAVRRGPGGEHTLVVLDEVTYPINWGWIDVDDVVATLAARPGRQHVVITGRRADPALITAASLVTEMTKIKHPMDAGQKGQRGIEW